MTSRLLSLCACVALFATPATAAPIVLDPSYSISRVAGGGGALDGSVIGSDGFLYVTDYGAGTLLRISLDAVNGSFEVVASGLANPTDVTRTPDGRLFVTESLNGRLTEVLPGGVLSVFASGFDTATSIDYFDNRLIVTNSSPGTITSTDLTTKNTTTILSGLNFAYGATVAPDGSLYYINFGTGGIYGSDLSGASPTLLTQGSAFGAQFTALSPDGQLFVSDPVTNTVYMLSGGSLIPFATGFTGKAVVPIIGPTGIAFDSTGTLFVSDAGDLWRITAPTPVPEPASLLLLGTGIAGIGAARRRRKTPRNAPSDVR